MRDGNNSKRIRPRRARGETPPRSQFEEDPTTTPIKRKNATTKARSKRTRPPRRARRATPLRRPARRGSDHHAEQEERRRYEGQLEEDPTTTSNKRSAASKKAKSNRIQQPDGARRAPRLRGPRRTGSDTQTEQEERRRHDAQVEEDPTHKRSRKSATAMTPKSNMIRHPDGARRAPPPRRPSLT